MKAKDFPMKTSVLFKVFDKRGYFVYDELTKEEKEYDITSVFYEVFGAEKRRVCVIASKETMDIFGMEPKKFNKAK